MSAGGVSNTTSNYRKGVRRSAKPLLEDLVMQPSFMMLCSWGALGYVHDWLTSSVTNDSSLKLCWLSCHCKSTPAEHTSVQGWQVWEQCQAKITYILEVSNGREVVQQWSVGYFLESPVQYSLQESKIYPNHLPAPSAGLGKHGMDVDNDNYPPTGVYMTISIDKRKLLCIGSVLQLYLEWEK